MNPANLLEIENLTTHFFTESGTVKAVDGISFALKENETIGIVGESGCGKSATALSIMRLIHPPTGRIVRGEVRIQGRDILKLSERDMRQVRGGTVSMIFQDPMTSLNPVFSIGNQITEAIVLHQRIGRKRARETAISILESTRIPKPDERLDKYPFEFSGGMRQRVMIAMALACKPKILIADEPTTALDVTIQAQILRLINELKALNNTSVIMITHDLGITAEMADRVMVMYAGRIIEYGPVDEIYYRPHHPYTVGLLRSIPRMSSERGRNLYQINGNPPQLLHLPSGCSFEPRCECSLARCRTMSPGLKEVGDGHMSACFLDSPAPGERPEA